MRVGESQCLCAHMSSLSANVEFFCFWGMIRARFRSGLIFPGTENKTAMRDYFQEHYSIVWSIHTTVTWHWTMRWVVQLKSIWTNQLGKNQTIDWPREKEKKVDGTSPERARHGSLKTQALTAILPPYVTARRPQSLWSMNADIEAWLWGWIVSVAWWSLDTRTASSTHGSHMISIRHAPIPVWKKYQHRHIRWSWRALRD